MLGDGLASNIFGKGFIKTKSKFDILGLKMVVIEPTFKTEIFKLIFRVKFWCKSNVGVKLTHRTNL